MSMSTIEVRCGLTPSSDILYWDIRTEHVENYLEKKFAVMNSALAKKGENPKPIDVSIRGIRIGEKFIPLLCTLSDNVLDKANYDPSIPLCFRSNSSDDGVKLKPYYWQFLRNYMYTGDEIRLFTSSSSVKNELRIRQKSHLEIFQRYSKPAIENVEGFTDNQRVLILLDPIKIFHEMLVIPNNQNQRFATYINEITGTGDDKYVFRVSREVRKRRKSDDDLAKAIMKNMMKNAGRR